MSQPIMTSSQPMGRTNLSMGKSLHGTRHHYLVAHFDDLVHNVLSLKIIAFLDADSEPTGEVWYLTDWKLC